MRTRARRAARKASGPKDGAKPEEREPVPEESMPAEAITVRTEPIDADDDPPGPAPEQNSCCKGPKPCCAADPKTLSVVLLAILAIALAYLLLFDRPAFIPGEAVDAKTFAQLLADAENVFIVMDVRGSSSQLVQTNILQCGVDFSASTGLADKDFLPIAVDESDCVTPEGSRDVRGCFSLLQEGITIYVVEGEHTYFHANGMVVGVDESYEQGTCAINRA